MQLSFPANKQTELTFKVGIAGTSSLPQSVQVVLERDATLLSFAAKSAGDSWVAVVENPGKVFGSGQVKLSVNVVLNNHMFTPMKATADIIEDVQDAEQIATPTPEVPPEIEVAPVVPEVEPEVVVAPEVTLPVIKPKRFESLLKVVEKAQPKKEVAPVIQQTFKPTPKVEPKVEVKPLPKVAEKVEIIQPIKMQLLKSIEPGIPTRIASKIVEAAPVKQKESLFKLKKTKIIYK